MNDANNALHYVFPDTPEPGAFQDIAPGVRWIRLPLPFELETINVWLIREGEGWALVDTGLFSRTSQEIWHHLFEQALEGLPLTRVIVTHLHPDHVGCAGWLCSEFDVELWMPREEFFLCHFLVSDTGHPAPEEGVSFYQKAGFPEDQLKRYKEVFGAFGRVVSPLPRSYRRLQHGDDIRIGDHSWRVSMGHGHSPEHACLLCNELNLVIAGDQLLPTISSNVSVYPTEPDANPLALWFESLDSICRNWPEDITVLPAHGRPFKGAHVRAQQLIDEHRYGLEQLVSMISEPKRAVDVFPALFKSRVTGQRLILATGEAIAHLHYLMSEGKARVSADQHGVNWYQSA